MTDSERKMTEQQIHDEFTYQLTMIQIITLVNNDLVKEEEIRQFKEQMIEKYKPFISRLSSK